MTKLTVMMGGPYWSTYPADASGKPMSMPRKSQELIDPALEHLQSVFPILRDIEPVLVVPRLQKDCIPTYRPGHYDRLKELHEAIATGAWNDKLSLAGAAYYGPSVNDCVWSAESIAQKLGDGDWPTGLEWALETMER